MTFPKRPREAKTMAKSTVHEMVEMSWSQPRRDDGGPDRQQGRPVGGAGEAREPSDGEMLQRCELWF